MSRHLIKKWALIMCVVADLLSRKKETLKSRKKETQKDTQSPKSDYLAYSEKIIG